MMVEVDLQAFTGEGITLPRFTVEIPQDMLMKIGRLIALQKGMMPDNAVDIFPVEVKFVHVKPNQTAKRRRSRPLERHVRPVARS